MPGSVYAQPTASCFGTAPRRVSPGVWRTRTGRALSPSGAAYWESHYRAGRTDGRGHMTRPSVVQQPKPVGPVYEDGSYRVGGGRVYDPDTGRVRKRTVLPPVQQGPRLEAAQPPPKRPNFTTVMRAQKGDQQARVQIRRYEQHRQATAAAKAQVQALQDQAFFGEALLAVQGAYKTVNPIADAIIKSL